MINPENANIVDKSNCHTLTVDKITSYLVHDISNVLQTIVGSADMLIMAKSTDSLIHAKAQTIKTASMSAIKLMNYILDLNYKKSPKKRILDINISIKNISEILDRICGSRVNVYYDLKSNIPPVVATELYVEEILLNLVVNARDAIKTEGIINISTGIMNLKKAKEIAVFNTVKAGNYVYVSVKDNGNGIPENIMELIHQPTFTTKKNGNGIGLHIVYTIAKELSGFVTVESTEYKGTTISVHIPGVYADAAA